MAADYTELKAEIQSWLDRSDPNLIAAIPTMIIDAESQFSRILRTWEMECSSLHPLVPDTGDPGQYVLPADWVGQVVVNKKGTDLNLVYYQRIPNLSDTVTTNWLLQKHPDLYRYGSLASAESWLMNDPRIELWKVQMRETIAVIHDMSEADQYSGPPLRSITPDDRVWELLRREDGTYERLGANEFFDLVGSNATIDQLGLQVFGYFTIAQGKIHLWPKPSGDPTGPAAWSPCQ